MLPQIPKVSQLAPGIVRFLGMNPSPMTLQGTNSYLIGTTSNRLLIDTTNPERKDYIENVRQYFHDQRENHPRISDIIITHWHPDHIGSVPDILDLAKSSNWPIPNVYKFPSTSHPEFNHKILKDGLVMDLSEFGMGSLQVLYTPGHTDDHICLLLLPENIVFSGDLILGNGSTTFEDLVLYMASLRKLQTTANDISKIFPAHGVEILEPISKINEYLQHRLERVKQVHDALDTGTWLSEMDLVVKVYPADVINHPVLILGALKNQYEALKYLLSEGRAEARDCTEQEKNQQEYNLSGKMWKLTAKRHSHL